ncbi:uncharacterized protein DSM5745_02393 [Aspergillus mulundensis]|uniref:RING-type E3 ubiquitin transferase n=1 Tax=Aspergillus mulundensis TaxID=1810919 RepID=A0A3D8SXX1_9EURO|nr:hypothetical protein DSM5745_02393 [Aspergillus mulundensis]RDW90618.1 hypothetical protein DSM5745_02393 [Aspergillus mulundensis]
MGLLLRHPFPSRPSSFSFSFFPSYSLLFFLLSLLSTVQVVDSTVLPSNRSVDQDPTIARIRFNLEGSQVDLPRDLDLSIAPFVQSPVSFGERQTWSNNANRTGTLVQVGPSNSLSLQSSDIAFISCDPAAYTGNLDADATLSNVLIRGPEAVLLYSTSASHCNYTNDQSDYRFVFTLLNSETAREVERQLASGNQTGSTSIVGDMSTFGPASIPSDNGGGGGGDSPNTAAMIILYSITGIITALFLSIIITGAIRAHRHPERYGPRQRPGRPRQSRARGIARAMLETIPIVKFGDNADGKLESDKGDVEMSVDSETNSQLREDTHQPMATGGTTSPTPDETPRNAATSSPDANAEQRRTGTTETETPTEHPNFSCPICTDDFVKGQDLRVLPCNHQFHPECIDPWLVNVSGTCPLCRIDLNPPKREGETEGQEGEAQPQGHDETTNSPPVEEIPTHRHRLSSYLTSTLNARRMRDASVEERLAALRSVREEANRDAANDDENEQRSRRNRLTARFRERFRIRTRAHGEDATNLNAGAATPTST